LPISLLVLLSSWRILSTSNCPAAIRFRGSQGGADPEGFGEVAGGVLLTLAPRLVEDDDLVDEVDGREAAALRVADELGVAALLLAEEVDVEHLRVRRRIGVAAAAAAERKGLWEQWGGRLFLLKMGREGF
jgi:hypothetical protein